MTNQIPDGYLDGFNRVQDMIGFWLEKIPHSLEEHLNELTSKYEENLKDQIRTSNDLAGRIENEYKVDDKVLENYIIEVGKKYLLSGEYIRHIKTFAGNRSSTEPKKILNSLKCESLWVNFQKKYEFNPQHIHSGHLSYVIWHRIPYNKDKEDRLAPGKKDNRYDTGAFQFHVSDIIGNSTTSYVANSEEWNNIICVFPSVLPHSVTPFYSSNDYRVTYSGNMILDVSMW